MSALNLIGKKYNKLTIIEKIDYKSKSDRGFWYKCICECGNECKGKGSEIKSGRKKSCGCDNWKPKYKPFRSHYLYEVWHSMVQRCTNPNYAAYHNYGGRGIRVHSDWLVYEKFYDAIIEIYENQYEKGHHFDRINNEDHYKPGNVRFVNIKESARNKRGVKLDMQKANEIRNSPLSVKELVKIYGVKERQIYSIKENKAWI